MVGRAAEERCPGAAGAISRFEGRGLFFCDIELPENCEHGDLCCDYRIGRSKDDCKGNPKQDLPAKLSREGQPSTIPRHPSMQCVLSTVHSYTSIFQLATYLYLPALAGRNICVSIFFPFSRLACIFGLITSAYNPV